MPAPVILWFRRDLRLADHAALAAALSFNAPLLPVYLHAPDEEGEWAPGAASRWWLHHSLVALAAELAARGSRLLILNGSSSAALLDRLIAQTGAQAVCWHRLYEPAAVARDTQIKAALKARSIAVHSLPGSVLHEPWSVQTGADQPYKVFTPYWRTARGRLALPAAQAAPAQLPPLPAGEFGAVPPAALDLLPKIRWDRHFHEAWQPGSQGAHAALALFGEAGLADYADGRNRPDLLGTSRLSAHLHFGEITPQQIIRSLLGPAAADPSDPRWARAEPYVRELGWRDFNRQLLFHFPDTATQPLSPAWQDFRWEHDTAQLKRWQRGQTGIPIIDAGMRELWAIGWMHNRVRMLVASFLTKHLGLHWLDGARWFWDTLVDADLANNSGGWQWTAGCGADAAPYFRIFNPVTQGLKFDSGGDYVRRWVPELAHLDAKAIQQPWTVGGVRGYPAPMVDLAEGREAALARYAAFRGQ